VPAATKASDRVGTYRVSRVGVEQVRAFLPRPLPPERPVNLAPFYEKIESTNRALGQLDGVTSILPDASLFLYMYVRKEALLSSQIEGTQSSLSDLLLYESDATPGVPLDDVREVSNYVAAMDLGVNRLREGMPISNRLLREIHATLLRQGRGRNDAFDGLVQDVIGVRHQTVATLAGSLFLFIAFCNLAGQLPGVHPATGSIATTSALAAVVFLSVPIAGIRTHGVWDYFKNYFRPNPLLMPLHVISELSRTLALAVRLFGNVMSGHLVVALLVALAGFLVPIPIMALDLLIGLLQAYIFSILSTVYIGAAISAGE